MGGGLLLGFRVSYSECDVFCYIHPLLCMIHVDLRVHTHTHTHTHTYILSLSLTLLRKYSYDYSFVLSRQRNHHQSDDKHERSTGGASLAIGMIADHHPHKLSWNADLLPPYFIYGARWIFARDHTGSQFYAFPVATADLS
jgi:hypothetical protein